MSILSALRGRERDGRPIGVAVVGAGQMGGGLADQMARLTGLRLAAVCDVVIDRAAAAAARADVRAAVADTERDVARLLDEGRAVIASRPEWVVGAVGVDVVVDATGVPMRARGSRCSRSGGACPS